MNETAYQRFLIKPGREIASPPGFLLRTDNKRNAIGNCVNEKHV